MTAGRMVQGVAGLLWKALDAFVPKNQHIWLFGSHHGLNGNIRAVLEAALTDPRCAAIEFVFVVSTPIPIETQLDLHRRFPDRLTCRGAKSLRGILSALRAGTIFISHDIVRDIAIPLGSWPSRRRVINLWHGSAMKRHWLLSKRDPGMKRKAQAFTSVVASSKADAVAKAAAFGKALSDIWVTGIPRGDILCQEPVGSDLIQQKHELGKQLAGRRLLLYAPTWRKFQNRFAPLSDRGWKNLESIASQHNIAFGVRLHPADEIRFAEIYMKSNALMNLGSAAFPDTSIVLSRSAGLITDYSSIWIDYLLTGRPVIAYWPDYEHYQKVKGTIWNFERLFPGPIARTESAFEAEIDALLGAGVVVSPRYQATYEFARGLFHEFRDASASTRVLDRLHGMDGNQA